MTALLTLGLVASAQADTDALGGFTDSVPITVPSFHGIAPQLALTYGSSAPDGWIGVGWSLQGLSEIRRVSSDGGVPAWNSTDGFQLDGRDLIACPPTNATGPQAAWNRSPSCADRLHDEIAYTTRIESFDRIAYLPASESWVVWETNGVKETYEPGDGSSTRVIDWHLSTVEDLSGNKVTYSYAVPTIASSEKTDQPQVLTDISYSNTDVDIHFQTELRPDPLSVATGGELLTNYTRLQAIDESAGGERVRAYALHYSTDATRRSSLASVQQFGSDATVDSSGVHGGTSLPALSFQSPGQPAQPWSTPVPQSLSGWWPSAPTLTIDASTWNTTLQGGPGNVPFPGGTSGGPSSFDQLSHWVSGDFSGNGLTDNALMTPDLTVWLQEPRPDGGGYDRTEVTLPSLPVPNKTGEPYDPETFVGDVNGDGRDDLVVTVVDPASGTKYETVAFGDSTGGLDTMQTTPAWQAMPSGTSVIGVGDETDDGRGDLVMTDASCFDGLRVATSDFAVAAPTTGKFIYSDHTTCFTDLPKDIPKDNPRPELADLTGDGLADVVQFIEAPLPRTPGASAQIAVAMSDGQGGFTTKVEPIGPVAKDWGDGVACPRTGLTLTAAYPGFNCGDTKADPGDNTPVCETNSKPTGISCSYTYSVPEFFTDVDGDGRADLMVLAPGDDGKVADWTLLSRGDGTFTKPHEGTTPLANETLETIQENIHNEPQGYVVHPPDFLPLDLNGDGATDLATVNYTGLPNAGYTSTADKGVIITRLINDRSGNLSNAGSTSIDWCKDPTDPKAPYCVNFRPVEMTGDLNGDGQDDILIAHANGTTATASDGTSPGELTDLSASITQASPSVSQALTGDQNGDGREDLISPRPVDNGVEVRTFRRLADGSYRNLDPTTVSLPGNVIANLPLRGWIVADVNGDHRADLINLPAGQTQGVALLASGDNTWTAREIDLSSLNIPATSTSPEQDAKLPTVGRWLVVGTDGGERDELVHVGDGLFPNQYGILSLKPDADGALTPHWWGAESVPPDQLLDQRGWVTADVNGDGNGDLTHVERGALGIETLIQRPDGWQSVPSLITPLAANGIPPEGSPAAAAGIAQEPGADPAWVPVDANGDGDTDLARVLPLGGGGVTVETLLSEGDGHWSALTSPKIHDDDDPLTYQAADVDRDARGDLVGVYNIGAHADIDTMLSNGDGTWTHITQLLTPQATPATQSWQIGDASGDGRSDILRLTDTPTGPTVDQITATAPPDGITNLINGLGTTTTVQYTAGEAGIDADSILPADCSAPAAGAAPVVANVTTSDNASATTDSSSTTYGCMHYSPLLHAPVAWGQTVTTHAAAANRPAAVDTTMRATTDSGLVEPTSDTTTDEHGAVLAKTITAYVPTAGGADTDLVASEASSVCSAGQCATATSNYTYDTFGNIVTETNTATGSDQQRLTTTDYLHDNTPWLQDLPRLVKLIDPRKPTVLIRSSLTCYDGDTSPNCDQPPALLRGLPTMTRSWDNLQGRYITTGQTTYDNYGNPLTITDADGHTTTTTWDPATHLYPTAVCNALMQCTQTVGWDWRAEAPTETIDPNGNKTLTTYDALGRVQQTVLPSGLTTTKSYTTSATTGTLEEDVSVGAPLPLPKLTAAVPGRAAALAPRLAPTYTDIEDTPPRTWSQTYTDGLGRVYRTITPGATDEDIETDTQYSDASTRPYRTAPARFENAAAEWTDHEYDALGRPTTVTNPDHSATSTTYAVADGSLQETATDENGHPITRVLDGSGTLSAVDRPSIEHPGQPATVKYTYDVAGDPLTVTDAHGNVTTTTWDTLGNETAQDDPDRGHTTYAHDPAGNLIKTTDALGQTITYGYDRLNRRTSETDPVAHIHDTWTYDEPGHGDSIGQLTSVHDPSAKGCPDLTSDSLTYDAAGQVTTETRCVLGHRTTITTTYDGLGRIHQLTYPGITGQKPIYQYDAAGNVKAVPGWVNGMTYNASGQILQADNTNGTTNTWAYSPTRQWQTSEAVTHRGKTLFAQNTSYYPNGQIQSEQSPTQKIADTYTYNTNGDLATAHGTGQTSQTYDDIGNITSTSAVGSYTYPNHRVCASQAVCAGPDAVTQAGANTYDYDADGDMLSVMAGHRIIRRLTWDPNGLITEIQDAKAGTTRNLYNAEGDLVQQITRQSTTDYFGPLVQCSPCSRFLPRYTTYIPLSGELSAAQRGSNSHFWYTSDERGTTRAATGGSGRLAGSQATSAFGQPVRKSGDTGDIAYAGHRSAGSSQLIDMGARDYDPALGRMISADTIVPDLANPDELNRYTYADNDPIDNTDPTGHNTASGDDQAWRNNYWLTHLYLLGLGAGLTFTSTLIADGNTIQRVTVGAITGSSAPANQTTPTAVTAGLRGLQLPTLSLGGVAGGPDDQAAAANNSPDDTLTPTAAQPTTGTISWLNVKAVAGAFDSGMPSSSEMWDNLKNWLNQPLIRQPEKGSLANWLQERGYLSQAEIEAISILAISEGSVLGSGSPGILGGHLGTGGAPELPPVEPEVTPTVPRFIVTPDGVAIDLQAIGDTISAQRQARHLIGSDLYNGGGFLTDLADAQAVLDALHSGDATVLGPARNGIYVRYDGVTGYNNNPVNGFFSQATDVFMIKGTKSVSVVPVSPAIEP